MELHRTQKIVAHDRHPYRVVCCGRQWGKTTLSILEMIAWAYAQKGREIAYFATTYDQARNISWNLLKESSRPIWAKSPNESRLELVVKTRDLGESRITLRGFENIETARGQQFDFLVIDEVAQVRNWEYAWQAILEPTLVFRRGHALFISTPLGFNHFHTMYLKGQTENDYWKSWRFPSTENPFIPRERIEQAKAESTEDYFSQEYEADFRKRTGLVYKDFSRETHVIPPMEILPGWKIYRGLDFGSTNPTVCLWIAVDNDDNYYIIDEHYQSNQTIDFHAGVINANKYSSRVSQSWGDPSGAQYITEFAQRGIYITAANKEIGTGFNSWVRFGIEKVAEKLKVVPGKKPKLYVFSTCEQTIREFETYRWKTKKTSQVEDLNEPDVPEKANDHAMDALRCMVVSNRQYIDDLDVPDDTQWVSQI